MKSSSAGPPRRCHEARHRHCVPSDRQFIGANGCHQPSLTVAQHKQHRFGIGGAGHRHGGGGDTPSATFALPVATVSSSLGATGTPACEVNQPPSRSVSASGTVTEWRASDRKTTASSVGPPPESAALARQVKPVSSVVPSGAVEGVGQ